MIYFSFCSVLHAVSEVQSLLLKSPHEKLHWGQSCLLLPKNTGERQQTELRREYSREVTCGLQVPWRLWEKKKVSVDQMPLLVFLCSLLTLLVFTSTHSWLSFSSGCSDNRCLLFSERGHSNCLKIKGNTHNFCENEVCLAITYTPPS